MACARLACWDELRVGQVRPGRPCIGACEYIRLQLKGREFIAGAPRSTCATPSAGAPARPSKLDEETVRRRRCARARAYKSGIVVARDEDDGSFVLACWSTCACHLPRYVRPLVACRRLMQRQQPALYWQFGTLHLHTACSLSSACTVMRQPCPGWYIIHVVENVGVLYGCRSFVPHLKIEDSFKKSFQAPKCVDGQEFDNKNYTGVSRESIYFYKQTRKTGNFHTPSIRK